MATTTITTATSTRENTRQSTPTKTHTRPDQLDSKIAYLTRVLKTPTIGRVWHDLAETARDANCGPTRNT
jgi:hypothetical protein